MWLWCFLIVFIGFPCVIAMYFSCVSIARIRKVQALARRMAELVS